MERFLERLGGSAARHPLRIITCWLIAAIALIALGQVAGGTFIDDFRFPGAEAQVAADLAEEHFPSYGTGNAEIVFADKEGQISDHRPVIDQTLAAILSQPRVLAVEELTVSPDGRAATTTIRYGGELGDLDKACYNRLDRAAAPARAAGLTVEFRGMVVDVATQPTSGVAELVGLGAALVVLLIAFGSVVAAGLPIAVALAGLAAGTALTLLVGSVIDIPTSAPIIAVMLGMGAGIDYALFVVTRFRRALAASERPPGRERTIEAAGVATATAGHAVLFAGGTVVVAILGLWFAGIPFIASMGLAGALMVAVMVISALTLLPALLGLIGDRVDSLRLRLPLRVRARQEPGGGGWARWAAHVARYRWGYVAASVLVLLALASPLLSLRLGAPDDGTQPLALTQRRAYELVAEHFGPGWNGPLVVAVEGGSTAGSDRLAAALAADPEVAVASPAVRSADGMVALITLVPKHAPQDQEITDLVHRMRDTLIPASLGPEGGNGYVGGATALIIDTADIVGNRLPWVVAAVVTAAALLLYAMFRAPVIALKAAAATLLSIGAAYGVLVAVFQWGWGLDLVGVDKPVPIMSVVPMLLFAVLFGLSMDYEVFLLSSVRESYSEHGDPGKAVVAGLASTGRVITAAAVIMACVFLSFVSINDSIVKMLGLGLATAVVVDATVIRVALVPAVLAILGRAAWWGWGDARRSGVRDTPGSG